MKLENIFEALRIVDTVSNEEKTRVAKVYKDTEWDEFRVKFFVDGKHQAKADYHTDDKDDAKSTAQAWANKKYEK